MVNDWSYQEISDSEYEKCLNKNQPFDQLIIELGRKGILDICTVKIEQEKPRMFIKDQEKYS